MTATTNEIARSVRRRSVSLVIACGLILTPYVAAPAADQHESSIAAQARSFGAAVKHDAKVVGDGCKDVAHRLGVAAKAVGHEVATAAKRGAEQTRAAFSSDKAKRPAR